MLPFPSTTLDLGTVEVVTMVGESAKASYGNPPNAFAAFEGDHTRRSYREAYKCGDSTGLAVLSVTEIHLIYQEDNPEGP